MKSRDKKTVFILILVVLSVSLFFVLNMDSEEVETDIREFEDTDSCFELIDDKTEQQKCVVTVAGNQDNVTMCGEIQEGFEDFKIVCRARVLGEKDKCGEVEDDELERRCHQLVEEHLEHFE